MKIYLEKFRPNDFDAYYSLVQHDEVMKYVSGKGLSREEAELKFHFILIINSNDEEFGYFKVHNEEGQFIGDCKLTRYQQDLPALEIGYILKKSWWRQGYGTAICHELLTLARQLAPESDVVGIIDPENTASKKLLEKFGFKSYFVGIENSMATEMLMLRQTSLKSPSLHSH
ncbi:MAG: GNAT family N-acetyltransferase [Arcticibacter sp.]